MKNYSLNIKGTGTPEELEAFLNDARILMHQATWGADIPKELESGSGKISCIFSEFAEAEFPAVPQVHPLFANLLDHFSPGATANLKTHGPAAKEIDRRFPANDTGSNVAHPMQECILGDGESFVHVDVYPIGDYWISSILREGTKTLIKMYDFADSEKQARELAGEYCLINGLTILPE